VDLPRSVTDPLVAEDAPPVSGQGMPPIVIQSEPGMIPPKPGVWNDPAVFQTLDKCDIPCKYEINMPGRKRYVAGTEWKIVQTADDPYFLSDANKIERTAFRHDTYYSTASLQSSVPLSSYSFELTMRTDRSGLGDGAESGVVHVG
jgi:hypothetical protein